MDLRTFWHLRLPTAQQPKLPPDDELLAHEDDETRAAIAHYLHLADRLLSAESDQEEQDKDTAA